MGIIFFSVKVIWDKDLAEDSPVPWYLPLDPSRFSLSSFRLTTVGRAITRTMVRPTDTSVVILYCCYTLCSELIVQDAQ